MSVSWRTASGWGRHFLRIRYTRNITLDGHRCRIDRLRFYIFCGLSLSFHHSLSLHDDQLTADNFHDLLEFATDCASIIRYKNFELWYEIIRNLLDARLVFKIDLSDFRSLDPILQNLLSQRDAPSNTREESLALWDSLRKANFLA